jgi:hypothetical protein
MASCYRVVFSNGACAIARNALPTLHNRLALWLNHFVSVEARATPARAVANRVADDLDLVGVRCAITRQCNRVVGC